jgi:hypothetical protein
MAEDEPTVEAVWVERLRAMTDLERAAMIAALTEATTALAMAGIRERHPQAGTREVMLRLGVLRNGPALMRDAYGWDAAKQGY